MGSDTVFEFTFVRLIMEILHAELSSLLKQMYERRFYSII